MVPLPDPGAPMIRVLALLPLERDLDSDTVTRDLLDTLVKRLDNKVLENIVWNIENDNILSKTKKVLDTVRLLLVFLGTLSVFMLKTKQRQEQPHLK